MSALDMGPRGRSLTAMKTTLRKSPSKSDLAAQVELLRTEIACRDVYLREAFRGKVTHFTKGPHKLSVCGETSASGGVICQSQTCDSSDARKGTPYVVGVYYFETWFAKLREYPFRSDDAEGFALRALADTVARHVADRQAEFYAPKVAAAVAPLAV